MNFTFTMIQEQWYQLFCNNLLLDLKKGEYRITMMVNCWTIIRTPSILNHHTCGYLLHPKDRKNKQIFPMMLKIKFNRFFSFIIKSTLKFHRSIMHFMKQPLVPALILQKKENFLPQKEVSFGLQYMNQSKIQASFQGMILILNSHS